MLLQNSFNNNKRDIFAQSKKMQELFFFDFQLCYIVQKELYKSLVALTLSFWFKICKKKVSEYIESAVTGLKK